MNEKVVAIVQARMGSRRLPGKAMRLVDGVPMVSRVMDRTAKAHGVDKVVLAIGDDDKNNTLALYAQACGYAWCCFHGLPPEDVLGRYAKAAELFDASVIVRITSDCPLIDSDVIGDGVEYRARKGSDYVTNTGTSTRARGFPDGLDVEVMTRALLDRLNADVTDAYEREHVTSAVHRIANKTCAYWPRVGEPGRPLARHGELRWSVDTLEDLAFVSEVFRRMRPRVQFSWLEVLATLGNFARRTL